MDENVIYTKNVPEALYPEEPHPRDVALLRVRGQREVGVGAGGGREVAGVAVEELRHQGVWPPAAEPGEVAQLGGLLAQGVVAGLRLLHLLRCKHRDTVRENFGPASYLFLLILSAPLELLFYGTFRKPIYGTISNLF